MDKIAVNGDVENEEGDLFSAIPNAIEAFPRPADLHLGRYPDDGDTGCEDKDDEENRDLESTGAHGIEQKE